MAILHITFSLSTQGSIKHAIRQNHLQRDESVLCVNDIFSIGPLNSLEERKNWLEAYIFNDNEERELYEDIHEEWKKKMAGLPCDVDVWVWYSQSSHEEIGLRFIMSELINKCSMVYGIDATEGLKRVQPNMMIRHTGELASDMLMKLRSEAKRFSIDDCQRLAKEWEVLKQKPSTLRVWQNGIVHVAEDALDPIIIECAKRAHAELKEEWLIPMRVIGETIGAIDDYLSEEFVGRRLIALAKQGLFEIDGDTTEMYSYQVKYVGK
ncbi:DUF1835 domain-containing protein [Lysinibacillus agricola]|uniref:DUF1835 domain-containing protein n=1 Tax=Lysinibacillus agricola TaxID=2590012 RepID=A0ABX7B1F9_9BACI|nr:MULTISPECIES: DUF1835 domain-containing protein [Lysinibacillus]KOS63394.1 hypothetical protein AN161_06950 [Lysinibacillus sp. FJAT-14222]QQP14269.1 DUF1835 domain-containing protein [Lysinibacillus agricola]